MLLSALAHYMLWVEQLPPQPVPAATTGQRKYSRFGDILLLTHKYGNEERTILGNNMAIFRLDYGAA